MSAFFEPAEKLPPPDEADAPGFVDPFIQREEARRRWPARAAAWRAAELAGIVFEGRVVARLGGASASGPFRGLVHLAVPFDGIERHAERERVFVACASRDELLAAVPLVFVFEPRAS